MSHKTLLIGQITSLPKWPEEAVMWSRLVSHNTEPKSFLSPRRPQQVNWVRVEDDVPSHAVITGSDLFIENLNKSYNGTYRCVASNSVGEAYDDYILFVRGKFKVIQSSSVSSTSCSFTHFTAPSESWVNNIDLNDISFPLGHVLIWPFSSWNLLLLSFSALSLWWNCCPPFSECNNGFRAILKRICPAMRIFKWTDIQFLSVAREANPS